MFIEGKPCWLNHINSALEKYNNRVHHAIRMTHFEMSTNTNKPILSPKPNDNKKGLNVKWVNM